MSKGWYGVDLDGTLAFYDGWQGQYHIGEPIEPMVSLVKHLMHGNEVRIFTARVSGANELENEEITSFIQDWLEKAGLPRLKVTCRKDFSCIGIYDDRAFRVEANTGRVVVY
jgi:hypothetical protein